MKLNFTIDKIYLAGVGIMLITLIMNIWSLTSKWNFLIIPDKISSICGLLLTGLWTYFFYFLYTTSKPKKIINVPQKSDDDMIKLIEIETKSNEKEVK